MKFRYIFKNNLYQLPNSLYTCLLLDLCETERKNEDKYNGEKKQRGP